MQSRGLAPHRPHGERQRADPPGRVWTLRRGEAEVTQFVSSLPVQGRVSASTQNQALSAILFLYRELLGRELPWLDGVQRPTRPPRLPGHHS